MPLRTLVGTLFPTQVLAADPLDINTATADLAFGKEVTLQTYGHDKHGRTIGDVILSHGQVLNHELVRTGMCWWYRKYAPLDPVLEGLEKDAREAKRGLWADPHPVPPWEWRQLRRGRGPSTRTSVPA